MTLPTGTIYLSQVNTELGRAAGTYIDLNWSNVRSLAGRASGTISMNDLRGKTFLTFDLSPGSYADANQDGIIDWTITASTNVTWNATVSGSGQEYSTSGIGVGRSITVGTVDRPGGDGVTNIFTITASLNGVNYTWVITLQTTNPERVS